MKLKFPDLAVLPELQSKIAACERVASRCTTRCKITLFTEIKRFMIVGFTNTVIDLVVLNSLILVSDMGRTGPWFMLFKAVSFLAATTNSYFINHSWTFGLASARTVAKAGQFLLVSLVGAMLNVTAASYVATFVPAFHGLENYWPSIAALAGTACSLISNFLFYKHIVFAVDQTNRKPS